MLSSTLTNHFLHLQGPPFFGKLLHRYPSSSFMARRACAPSFTTHARAVGARIHNPRKNSPSKPKSVITFPAEAAGSSAAVPERRMESPVACEERMPLSVAVSDCVRRWFKDTLKAALAGDTSMQILVAQMYQSGYGVPKNEMQVQSLKSLIKVLYIFG
jgi:hypothetical protein